jgi:hypothetical protein
MAAAGAVALGVIFGVHDWLTVGVIAARTGSGVLLRCLMSRASSNPFLQPFAETLPLSIATMLSRTRRGASP